MNFTSVDNNLSLSDEFTPNKKRKRTNDGNNFTRICSTPKNYNGQDNPALDLELISPKYYHNKENIADAFMEVKSISDLISSNPFEVIRKPPKKKKKHDIEDCCFINPALNLNGPEKEPPNPFEVKRLNEDNTKLNNNETQNGIENFGLDAQSPPPNAGIAIGLPFTPKIGRRINFKDLPDTMLTPSGLLAKNLVFSPEVCKQTPNLKSKKNYKYVYFMYLY